LNTPHFFDPSEEKEFSHYLQQDSENYFIIEEANSIIGSGGFNYGFDKGKTARISWGMIHPDWHGKGIGTKLTQYRINEIKKHPEVEAIVVRTTKVVHGFYQKQGFELIYIS
jgi:[ribosomal protein S18]-alanine N-acetyltransferase